MADEDDGDDPGLAGLSEEFQRVIGGMDGHAASFQKMLDKRSAALQTQKAAAKDDEMYFDSYSDLAIHEDMLKDRPRVDAYQTAIFHYAARLGKVVDVGSGTGLLAVLSARAGAEKVYAVEASRLAHFLPKIMESNAVQGRVEVMDCKAEDLALPPGVQVDVVISEWMGYFLLFENMLPSVLAVRDRHLRAGGLMLPSRCSLRAAPLQDDAWQAEHIGFWRNVHGIDMSALEGVAKATASEAPKHRIVSPDGLLCADQEILALDLHAVKASDLEEFEAELSFKLPAGRRMDAVATWFTCDFGEAGTLLSTGPVEAPTHWRQTVFWMRSPIDSGGGLTVEGSVKIQRHESFSRGYTIIFELMAPGRRPRLEKFELH